MDAVLDYVIKYVQLIRISDFIDIGIVAFLMYKLIHWIQETRAMQLVKGIVILFLVLFLSDWLHLDALNYILSAAVQVGMFAIVVIFQPELRSLLERMGRSKVGKLMDFATTNSVETEDPENAAMIDDIVTATVHMSKSRIGALIVIERDTRLGEVMKTGTQLDAAVSSGLLENIFVPNTPLHDGAVIIRGSRIMAAGCFLPLTSNANISKELGTRHRAALGISEASDAVVIVVSEETGKISIAVNGTLTRNLEGEPLRRALSKIIRQTKRQEPLDKIKFWKVMTK